eukprot:541939-Lingulodinium_polyedra.AAC.1
MQNHPFTPRNAMKQAQLMPIQQTPRLSHAREIHARARKPARTWSAQACDSRAAAAANNRFDRIAV